jgi:hypothetical protein
LAERQKAATSREDARRAFLAIGQEPADGFEVQVRGLPAPIKRRFRESDFGSAVCAWVANQDCLWDGPKEPDFRLLFGNHELEPGRTLADQSIRGRTLFQISRNG